MNTDAAPEKRGFSGKQVLLFLLLAVLVTAGITYWLIRTYAVSYTHLTLPTILLV